MSTLSDLSIRRPVFAWMLMLGLIVFGAICFQKLPISQMPDVDFPNLTISVEWDGAAPEVIEAGIVDKLESNVMTVQGITEVSSTIRQGQASINLDFDLSRDIDAALQEVQSAISRVRMPPDVDPPTIRKSNPEEQPIMWLGVSGNKTLHELIEYVDLNLKDQFQILPGVGEVTLGGFTERNLRIWVDNAKLKKYELTILDVREALRQGHLETAAGQINNDKQQLSVRVMGEGLTPKDVGNIYLGTRGGRPIFNTELQIKDVAEVEDGLNEIRRLSRVNGVLGVGIGIRKQHGANTVEVGERVKARMEEVAKTLPKDINIGVNFDSTVFVKESIEETEFTLLLSAVVTAVVCFLFLGSWSPTFNILLSIPTSIVGSFSIIYFMGFTLNFFTILGLALAIGIVVDDAIMVLENIYRHREMGKTKIQAASDGAKEITFAAVAASVAVIAIFLPVAFMSGVIGKFFFQFGVTISAAVALSLLEAITLTPMRCSQFMEDPKKRGFFARFLDSVFNKFAALYRWLLRFALVLRWPIVICAGLLFWQSLSLLGTLRKEFIPPQDQSMFLMRLQTPIGSSLQFTSEASKQVEAIVSAREDVRRIYLAVGGFGGGEVNTAMMFVSLKPPAERKLTQAEIMTETRKAVGSVPNVKAFLQDLSTRGFTARRGFPVELNIRGPEWSVLNEKSKEIIAELEKTGLAVDIDTDYRLGQPEIRVTPNRARAAERGVGVQTISDTVSAAIGSVREGEFTRDGRRYDARLSLKDIQRNTAEDIMSLQLRNRHGELIPISEVASLETVPTLQTITRKNRERSISIFANVAPGKSQAEALKVAEQIARKLLPAGYRVYLGGGAQTFIESFQSLNFVLLLGLAVAYMVLASQFNSFIHPFTVLLALPFSLTGALYGLSIMEQSINLYSMIGVILLMGIVKKNSILLVEFINHKRYVERESLNDAILDGAPIRLRPILMTSVSTIAAALPPALAVGPGAESRIPMSVTIVGGVLLSTLFTLFVVPCAYRIFAKLERRHRLDEALESLK